MSIIKQLVVPYDDSTIVKRKKDMSNDTYLATLASFPLQAFSYKDHRVFKGSDGKKDYSFNEVIDIERIDITIGSLGKNALITSTAELELQGDKRIMGSSKVLLKIEVKTLQIASMNKRFDFVITVDWDKSEDVLVDQFIEARAKEVSEWIYSNYQKCQPIFDAADKFYDDAILARKIVIGTKLTLKEISQAARDQFEIRNWTMRILRNWYEAELL